MMNYVATTAVNKFLGSYLEVSGFKNLSTELIEIENAIIKTNALSDAGLPITVRYGRVGNLKLHIPGGLFALVRGYHDIIKVEIEDLFLLIDKVVIAGAKAKEVYEHRKAADLDLDSTLYNQKLLELLDTTINAGGNNSTSSALSSTSSAGIIQQLLDAIFQNGQFELRRVHIRYEDTTSNPDEPFAIGITLDRFVTAGHITTNETNSNDNNTNNLPSSGSTTLARTGSAGIGPGMKVPMTSNPKQGASSSSTTTDSNFTNALPENGLMHRSAQIERLAIYWDPLTPTTSFGNVPDPRSLFMNGLSPTADHYYMLIPMSPSLSLIWNYRHLPNYPGMKVNLVITQLRTCITTSQYRGLIFLQSWLADAKMKEMRRNRPLPPPKPVPGPTTTTVTMETYKRQRSIYVRARWRYAIDLVSAMKSQFIYKPERWTLPKVIKRGSVRECYHREQKYKETYTAVLEATAIECKKSLAANSSTPAKIDEKLLATLKELERPLFYETILLWRTVTRLSYEQTVVTKMQNIAVPTENSGGGIIGSLYSFFGGSGGTSSTPVPTKDTKSTAVSTPGRSTLGNNVTTPLTITRRPSIDQKEIDRRLAEARSATDTTIFMDATAELRAATFMIVKDRGSPILTASFSGQAGYTATKGKTFTASLTIPDLQINDAVTKDSRFSNMITKRRNPNAALAENGLSSSSLLHILIENCPSPDVDLRINVKSQPLVVVFAPECIRALAKFAVVPPSAAAVRSAASATITNLQQQMVADTYAALESRKRIQFDAHIAAPVVILPENIRKADSRRLILQLGDVNFRSAKADIERKLRTVQLSNGTAIVPTNGSSVRDTISLDKNYDTWVLNVTNVAAKLQTVGSGVNTSAHVDTIDGEPIIEPINVDVCFQTCIQPTVVSTNRLRAQGALPRLAVRVSLPLMQQLHALQLQFEELGKGMENDYLEVQREFQREFAAAGIAEDDAAVQGLALTSTASVNNDTSGSSNIVTSKSVPSTPVSSNTVSDEEAEFAKDAAILADFSIGTVVLELFDVRTSANKEILLQRQRINGYPPLSILDTANDGLNDHSASDLSLALSGLSFGIAYGRRGAYASATLAGMECIDRYQCQGVKFQYLVSSTQCPAGVSIDQYYSTLAFNDTNLISINVSYRSRAFLESQQIPLAANVNFRELHIGYNPETIAAVQLYAYYLTRFFATTDSTANPSATAKVTAPVPALPPVSPSTSLSSTPAPSSTTGSAPSSLFDSIAAAFEDDSEEEDKGLLSLSSGTKPSSSQITPPTTDAPLPLYAGCPIQMHITARLGAVTLTMQKERMQRKVSTFIVGGLQVLYDSTSEGDGIEASLAQICLVDSCTEGTRHPLLLGKSIPAYDHSTNTPVTKGIISSTSLMPMVWARVYMFRKGSTVANGHDTLVEAKIAHLRFIYVQQAILEIADYALSGLLGTLVTSAAQLAGTVVADAAVSRTKLDITIDDIVLYVPYAASSLRSLAFDMGTIKVVNAFLKDPVSPSIHGNDIDTTIERMSINIDKLGIYSWDAPLADRGTTDTTPVTERLSMEGIKEPSGTLNITISRASNPKYQRNPAMDIAIIYDGIVLKMGRNQYSLLQDILTHNIGAKLDDAQKEIVHIPGNESISSSDTVMENVKNALQELQTIENKSGTDNGTTLAPPLNETKRSGMALRLHFVVNGEVALVLRGLPDRHCTFNGQDSTNYSDLVRFAIQNIQVDYTQHHDGEMVADVKIGHLLCCDVRKVVQQRISPFRYLISSADAFINENKMIADDSLYTTDDNQVVVHFKQEGNGATVIDVALDETIISAIPDTIERLLWFMNAPFIPAIPSVSVDSTALTKASVIVDKPSEETVSKAGTPLAFTFFSKNVRFLLPSAPSQNANFLLLGFGGNIEYRTDGSSPDALQLMAKLNNFHLQVVPSVSLSQVILHTNDPNILSTITPVIGPCTPETNEDSGYGSIAPVTLSPTKGTGTNTMTIIRQEQIPVNVTLNYSQVVRKDTHDGASHAEKELLRTAILTATTIGLAVSFSAANVVISALDFANESGLLDSPGNDAVPSSSAPVVSPGSNGTVPSAAVPAIKIPYRIIDNFTAKWDGLQVTLLDDAVTKLSYDNNPLLLTNNTTVPNKLFTNSTLPVSSALSAAALLQARLQKVKLDLNGTDGLYKLNSGLTISLRAWDRVKRSLQPLIQDQWVIGVTFDQSQSDRHAPPVTRLSIVASSPLLMSITDRFLIHSAAGLSRWSASLTEVIGKSTVLGNKKESPTVVTANVSPVSSSNKRLLVANRLRTSLIQGIVIEIPLVRLEVAVDIDEKRSRPLFRLYAVQLNGTLETKALLETPTSKETTLQIHPTVATISVSRFGVAGLHIIDRQQQLQQNTDFMFIVTSLPSNDNAPLLTALGTADDKQQVQKLRDLHAKTKFYATSNIPPSSNDKGVISSSSLSGSIGSPDSRSLVDITLESITPVQGVEIPDNIRGKNAGFGLPVADSLINVDFQQLHIGWNAQAMLEISQLAINMAAEAAEAVRTSTNATTDTVVSSANPRTVPTVPDSSSGIVTTFPSTTGVSALPEASKLVSQIFVQARELSLTMNKESIKRKVVHLGLSGFTFDLQSYGPSSSSVQDEYTLMNGSLRNVSILDLTRGPGVNNYDILSRSNRMLTVQNDPPRQETGATDASSKSVVIFTIRSFGKDMALRSGASSIIDVTVHPIQFTYLSTLVQEALDFLSNGMLNLLRLFSPETPVFTELESANDSVSILQFSNLRITIEEPCVRVPRHHNAKGGLELRLAKATILNKLEDCLIQEVTLKDQQNKLSTRSVRVGNEAYLNTIIGRNAAITSMMIDMHDLVATLVDSFSTPVSNGSDTGSRAPVRPPLLRYSREPVQLCISSYQSSTASSVAGSTITIGLPPLTLCFSDRSYSEFMTVLDGNIAAKPPTLATDKARCLFSRPSIPLAVPKHKDASMVNKCGSCTKPLVLSRNTCEACADIVCLACIAGEVWDEENEDAKRICRTCLAKFNEETKLMAEMQNDNDMSIISESPNPRSLETDSVRDDRSSVVYGSNHSGNIESSADSTVTFSYGELNQGTGDPLVVRVSLAYAHIDLVKEVSPVLLSLPDVNAPSIGNNARTDSPLAKLSLIGAGITYTSLPIATLSETAIELQSVSIIDIRLSRAKAKTRAILIPSASVEDHFSPLVMLTEKSNETMKPRGNVSNPTSRRNSGSKGHFQLSSTVSNLFDSAVGVSGTVKASTIHSTYRPPQLGLTITSSAGGASSLSVTLNSSDINPDVPAILEIISFFTANRVVPSTDDAPLPKDTATLTNPSKDSTSGTGNVTKTTNNGTVAGTNGPVPERIINIRIPSPQQEMDITVNINKVRIVIMQDATLENTQALLLAITAKVELDLYTSPVFPRIFAGLNPLWLRMCNARFPRITNNLSTSEGTNRTGKELVTRPLPYNPGYLARGKLQDSRMKAMVDLIEISLDRMRVELASSASMCSSSSSSIDVRDQSTLPTNNTFGNLDSLRIPIIRPFGLRIDAKTYATTVTQIDLSTLTDPLLAPANVIDAFDAALQNEIALMNTTTKSKRGSSSSATSSASTVVPTNPLPPLRIDTRNTRRHIDISNCVAIRSLPRERTTIDVKSTNQMAAALALSDVDLVTAVVNGWMQAISAHNEQTTQDVSSNSSASSAPVDASETGANPLALAAAAAGVRVFVVPEEWHPDDYEVIVPALSTRLGIQWQTRILGFESKDDTYPGESKVNILLADMERVSSTDKTVAMNSIAFDSGDGRFIRGIMTPIDAVGIIRPYDALVGINGVPLISFPDVVIDGTNKAPPNIMLRKDVERTLMTLGTPVRVLRFRSFPYVVAGRLDEGLSVGLIAKNSGLEREVVRLSIHNFLVDLFGNPNDFSKYVEADLNPARKAILADEQDPSSSSSTTSSSTTPPKPWMKDSSANHASRGSLSSGAVNMGGRASDLVVRSRSLAQVRRRRSLVIAQVQRRPAVQSIFGTLKLNICADGHNPRNSHWEPILESWRIQLEGSMFDNVYRRNRESNTALKLQAPMRILNISADPLRLSISEDLYKSLLRALSDVSSNRSSSMDAGTAATMGSLLAGLRAGDLVQSDLPPSACPYVIRNETGLRVALTYMPAAGRKEGVMWSRTENLASVGPHMNNIYSHVSSGGSSSVTTSDTPDDAFSMRSKRRGATIVLPHSEVGLAVCNYDRQHMLPIESTAMSGTTNAKTNNQALLPVPSTHLLCIDLDGAAEIVRDINIDAEGISAYNIKLYEPRSANETIVQMCVQTIVSKGRKLITLRSGVAIHNYSGIDLEVYADIHRMPVYVGTVAGRNSLAVPMDKLATNSVRIRPALMGLPDNSYELSQPINVNREGLHELTCKSAVTTGSKTVPSDTSIPNRRFAIRTYYRGKNRYLCVAIHSPLSIFNGLPLRLEYDIRSTGMGSGNGSIAPGETTDIFDVSGGTATCGPNEGPAEPELRIRISGYEWSRWWNLGTGEFDYNRSDIDLYLQEKARTALSRPLHLTTESRVWFPGFGLLPWSDDGTTGLTSNRTKKKAGNLPPGTGRLDIRIFSPHWIVNLTGLPLTFGERVNETSSQVVAAGMQVTGVQMTEEVYENERLYIVSWKNPLPTERSNWSNEDGTKAVSKTIIDENIQKMGGWKWITPWIAEGWDYESIGFDHFRHADHGGRHHFNPDFRPGDIVRRRKWYRVRERLPDGTNEASLSSSSIARVPGAPHGMRLTAGGLRSSSRLVSGFRLGSTPDMEADSVVLFSPLDGDLFIRIGSGRWTPGIPMNIENANGRLHEHILLEGPVEKGTAPNGAQIETMPGYTLALVRETAPPPFEATNCITIMPAFMIVNATNSSLRWRQAVPGPSLLPTTENNTQPECELPPVSYTPIWWTRGRYDVPKHIQFSPSSALGGWSPPMYVSRIEDRPSVDLPLAITIPGEVPYVRTIGSGNNYSLSPVGTVVIGVSVRPLPLVNGGTMLVVTQQTHPAAPLRPPIYVTAGNIVSGGEANTLARSFGLDTHAQEEYRRERQKRSSQANLTISASNPSLDIEDHVHSLIEVTRPYIAFVNHSKCVLAFKQLGARVLHKWGGVMAKDEVTKDHTMSVIFKKLNDLDGKLPSDSLGGAFAFSTTYVPPNSVVPVGLVDPQAVIDARGHINLKVYAMDTLNEQAPSQTPSFGPGVTVDLSRIESPIVLPTNVNGGTAVVIEVRLHGPTRKIVVYDEDRPVAIPKIIKSPRRDSTDSWELVSSNVNQTSTNRTASGDWEQSSDSDSVNGAQDAGALADALDFGTGNDAISASLNNLRNGVSWETSRDLGNNTPITTPTFTSPLATPSIHSTTPNGSTPASEIYKVRMWRESYRINIEEISLSVIMNETYGPSEIAHINLANIGLRYRGTPSQHNWLFGIQRFQIDDQDPNAYFPVVVAIGRPPGGRPPMPFFQARLRTIPRLDRDIIGPLAGDFASYMDGLHVTLAAMDIAPLRVRLSYEFLTRIIHGIGNLDRARQDYAEEERQRQTNHNEGTNDIGGTSTIEDAADVDMPSSIVSASKDNGVEEGQNTIKKLLRYRAAMDLDDDGLDNNDTVPTASTGASEATRTVLLRLLEGHRSDPFQALSFMDVASLGKLFLIIELKLGSSSTTTKVYDDDIKLLLRNVLPGRSVGMVTARKLIRGALRSGFPIPTTPIMVRPVTINGDFTSFKKFIQLLVDTASEDMKNILPNILGNKLLLGNSGQFMSKLSTDTMNMTDALSKGNATGVFSSGVSAIKNTIGGTVGLVSGVSDAIGNATDTLANSFVKTPTVGSQTPRTPDITIPNDNTVTNQLLGDGKPKNVLHGLTLGVFSATTSLAKGVMGVVTKPVEGAVKEGTIGFSKGLASGVGGLLAAPVIAATSGVSNVLQGIQAHVTDDKDSTMNSSSSSSSSLSNNLSANAAMDANAIVDRVRLPRVFYGQSSILRPYSDSDAQVLADLRSTTDTHIMRIMNDYRTKLVGTVELVDDYQEGNLLCILSTHLIILKSTTTTTTDGRQWSARWQISLNDVFGIELTETHHDRTDLTFETLMIHIRKTGRSGGVDTVPKRIVLAPGLPGLAENVRLQIEESKVALDTTINVTPVSPGSN